MRWKKSILARFVFGMIATLMFNVISVVDISVRIAVLMAIIFAMIVKSNKRMSLMGGNIVEVTVKCVKGAKKTYIRVSKAKEPLFIKLFNAHKSLSIFKQSSRNVWFEYDGDLLNQGKSWFKVLGEEC